MPPVLKCCALRPSEGRGLDAPSSPPCLLWEGLMRGMACSLNHGFLDAVAMAELEQTHRSDCFRSLVLKCSVLLHYSIHGIAECHHLVSLVPDCGHLFTD